MIKVYKEQRDWLTDVTLQLMRNFILLRSVIFEKCVILQVSAWYVRVMSGESSEVPHEKESKGYLKKYN